MLNRSLYIFVAKMAGYALRLVVPYFLVRHRRRTAAAVAAARNEQATLERRSSDLALLPPLFADSEAVDGIEDGEFGAHSAVLNHSAAAAGRDEHHPAFAGRLLVEPTMRFSA